MSSKKLSKEVIEIIKKRHNKGESYSSISLDLKIPVETLLYQSNDKYREKKKEYQREYNKKHYPKKILTDDERNKRNLYFRNRYKTNPEFREKHINSVKNYQKKKAVKKNERGC